MVESLVITLREGIEAALVIGIILAYLRKTGQESLRRPVYLGLALAVIASLGVAWFFRAVGFDPDNEYLEGALYAVAGLFVASMVIWMWRTARGLKGEMESRLSAIISTPKAGGASVLGLLLFTFFMAFREGVETVLFLAAVGLGEEANPLGLVGALLGLALACLFAVLFIRGSIKINLGRFFKVTGVVLLVLAAKLFAGAAHEFGEVKLIPLNKEIMAVLGYLVRDDTATMLVMALVAVPIFLLLWESLRQPRLASVLGESAAERRKRLALARLERTWQIALGAATLAIVLALGSTALNRPAALVNLLGTGADRPARLEGLAGALSDPDVSVAVYDKRRVFERRKMGHVTATADTVDEALDRARRARSALSWAELATHESVGAGDAVDRAETP